jgi:hypothetical protein
MKIRITTEIDMPPVPNAGHGIDLLGKMFNDIEWALIKAKEQLEAEHNKHSPKEYRALSKTRDIHFNLAEQMRENATFEVVK